MSDDLSDDLYAPSRPMYYDRQGNPITDPVTWALLFTPKYKRVAETTIGDIWVSTVWIGLDLSLSGPPLIFETMIFVRPDFIPPDSPIEVQIVPDGPVHSEVQVVPVSGPVHPEVRALDQDCWRYATEAEAIKGHDQVCVDVRVLLEQIKMADDVLTEAIERADQA